MWGYIPLGISAACLPSNKIQIQIQPTQQKVLLLIKLKKCRLTPNSRALKPVTESIA